MKISLRILLAIIALHATLNAVKVVTETKTNKETGDKEYCSTFFIEKKEALLQITNYWGWQENPENVRYSLYPELCKRNPSLYIIRHKLPQIIIHAFIDEEIVALEDESLELSKKRKWNDLIEPDNIFNEQGLVWTPWYPGFFLKSTDDLPLRGENRLSVQFRAPGIYNVTIPEDADLEVELTHGLIAFTSSVRTHFKKVACSYIQRPRESGILSKSKDEWTEGFGDGKNPLATLITGWNDSILIHDDQEKHLTQK